MAEESVATASEQRDIRLTGRFMITGLATGHAVFHWVMQSFVVVLPEIQAAFQPQWRAMSIPDVLEDKHLWEREVMMEAELDDSDGNATGKKILVPGPSIIKFSKTPTTAGPIPRYGEHNREIFGGLLGLDEDQLEGLVAEGVIN